MNNITKLVNRFKKANEKVEIAEHVLSLAVEDIVKKNPSVKEIEELIEKLPKDYVGVRRLYELIYRKQYTGGPLKR